MNTRDVLIYTMVAGCLLQAGRGLYHVGLVVMIAQQRGSAADASLKDAVRAASERPPAKVRVRFSRRDTAIIRRHFAPQHRNRTSDVRQRYSGPGQLPPGWQEDMKPIPLALERRLRQLPHGYWRGVFEGHAVIFKADGTISDATVVF